MLMQSAPRSARPMHSQQRTHTLNHHQEAQNTEQKHVTDRDRQLDLTQSFEQREDPHPEKRAGKAADEQNVAHLEIDIAPAPMGEHARHRGSHQLVGGGGDGDSGRDPDENQKRRKEKAAADAKYTREKPNRGAKAEQQENVERHLGDRQIDVHGSRGAGFPSSSRAVWQRRAFTGKFTTGTNGRGSANLSQRGGLIRAAEVRKSPALRAESGSRSRRRLRRPGARSRLGSRDRPSIGAFRRRSCPESRPRVLIDPL